MDAAIPAGSSRGWFGCSRVESLPCKSDRGPEACYHAYLARHQDQILYPHQLADRRDHLRSQPGARPQPAPRPSQHRRAANRENLLR